MDIATSGDTIPSIFEHFPRVATRARFDVARRRLAVRLGAVALPVTLDALARITGRERSARRALAIGSATALLVGAARWQLARWFTAEPAYQVEGRVGDLEVRRYPARVEARTLLDARDFDHALDTGFGRIACFLYGANSNERDIDMVTPVMTRLRDGRYETSFVMPPDRPLASLPRPTDRRVELREVPERRVGAIRFRGRFTRTNVEAHERELLAMLVDAGLSARGSATFAAYDSPATLPFLRRNELWIEIV